MTTQVNIQSVPASKQSDGLEAQSSTFQWTKQWYPLAVVEFLDPTRPHSVQLLGKDLVLWRDGSQTWRCFEDACPHRLVPLSEGRVEAEGTLLCAYHAWRFDGQGQCTHIPQAKDAETESKYRQSDRACAIAYPTQERQGILWVWGEPGEDGLQASQQQVPRLTPELDDALLSIQAGAWAIRDLPYGWDFFMENVSDPAHVPVSHHGLVGNRYEDPKFYDMPRLREMSAQEGLAYSVTNTPDSIERVSHDFQPPCLMRITTEFKQGGRLILVLYAVPTRPGYCRHIGRQILVKNEQGKVPPGLAFFSLPMPVWLSHVLGSLFLHQDAVFLHFQERIINKRQQRWLEEVYTPNPQDKMVIAFRQWLEKYAGGGVPWANGLTLPSVGPDKRQLFDVWHSHTKNCQVCQRALRKIRWARGISYGLAIALLFWAIMIDSRAIALAAASDTNSGAGLWLPPASFFGAIAAAALLAAVGYGLQRLTQLFYFYEFEHYNND